MSNLGMGVMIQMLGGNRETAEAHLSSVGKIIESVKVEDNTLSISFTDGSSLLFRDEGQSCCESRYMVCDDDLSHFKGASYLMAEIKSAPSRDCDYGDHEVQFLEITTSSGSFVCSNHNEHNGYYGGFWITARVNKP